MGECPTCGGNRWVEWEESWTEPGYDGEPLERRATNGAPCPDCRGTGIQFSCEQDYEETLDLESALDTLAPVQKDG